MSILYDPRLVFDLSVHVKCCRILATYVVEQFLIDTSGRYAIGDMLLYNIVYVFKGIFMTLQCIPVLSFSYYLINPHQ